MGGRSHPPSCACSPEWPPFKPSTDRVTFTHPSGIASVETGSASVERPPPAQPMHTSPHTSVSRLIKRLPDSCRSVGLRALAPLRPDSSSCSRL
jgi:hypothetical protein